MKYFYLVGTMARNKIFIPRSESGVYKFLITTLEFSLYIENIDFRLHIAFDNIYRNEKYKGKSCQFLQYALILTLVFK